MRTNVMINDGLMKKAMHLMGCKTKRETINAALELVVQLHKQKKVREYRGKLKWEGDLDKMRRDHS